MNEFTIQTDDAFAELLGDLREAYKLHQNSLSHVWYAQIAKELREDSKLGWRCYCKLHHAVPILREQDPEFRAAYDEAIKGLTYEQKLKVMRILPVTSRMNKAQMSEYLDEVQDDFRKRNVILTVPDQESAP